MANREVSAPIVVGLDGSASARAALTFALREGLARDTAVVVITTWISDGIVRQRVSGQLPEADFVRTRQNQLLAEIAADLPAMPPVSQLVLHDAGGAALVEAAKDAAMLVVGSSHKGMAARRLLGSVSEYCLRHARVPVVVVPDPSRVRENDYSDWLALSPAD